MAEASLKYSSSELVKLASWYAEEVRANTRLYDYFASDGFNQDELLTDRALLERMAYVTPELKAADAMLLRQGQDPFYDYSTRGSEWPFHLPEIQAGRYPLERLPEHLRALAERLYYHIPA